MSVKQGNKAKVTASIKIDPDLLKDVKDWAHSKFTNFSAVAESLLRDMIEKEKNYLAKWRESQNAIMEMVEGEGVQFKFDGQIFYQGAEPPNHEQLMEILKKMAAHEKSKRKAKKKVNS